MKKSIKILAIVTFAISILNASSDSNISIKNNNMTLLEKAKSIMPNTKIKDAISAGVGEMIAVLLGNDTIVYVDDKTKTIFFGEIYSQYGESLTKLHKQKLGVKPEKLNMKKVINEYGIKIKKDKNANFGVIVFTDPDCPYCKKIENILPNKNVEIDYIYNPIKELHPNSIKNSIKIIAKKLKIDENKAKERLQKSMNFAQQLGVMGTPYLIVYNNKTKDMVGAVAGADEKKLDNLIKGDNDAK